MQKHCYKWRYILLYITFWYTEYSWRMKKSKQKIEWRWERSRTINWIYKRTKHTQYPHTDIYSYISRRDGIFWMSTWMEDAKYKKKKKRRKMVSIKLRCTSNRTSFGRKSTRKTNRYAYKGEQHRKFIQYRFKLVYIKAYFGVETNWTNCFSSNDDAWLYWRNVDIS